MSRALPSSLPAPIIPLKKKPQVGQEGLMTVTLSSLTQSICFADAQGYMKYSALFYGYYNNQRTIGWLRYRLPMAYFMVGVSVFSYSLMIVIRS